MKRKTAAAYCDMSESSFARAVLEGNLPCAIRLGERDHWDKLALDAAISKLVGIDEQPDYRRQLRQRYGHATS